MEGKIGVSTISIIFVLMMLLGAFFVVAPYEVTALQDGNYTYTVSGYPAFATITGYTGPSGAITIPATLGGYPTVIIGAKAFEEIDSPFGPSHAHLTSVTIPDSVTTIENAAFWYSSHLTTINIGNNVKTIGAGAFYKCTALTTVIIPNSVETIGSNAFYGTFASCTSLTSVTIGSGVTSIGDFTFAYCSSLKSISFLGLVKPSIAGGSWIRDTNTAILGHSYANSNFPVPSGVFNGLTMGAVLPPPEDSSINPTSSDNSLLIALIIVIASIIVLFLLYMILRKEKTVPPSINPGQIPRGDDYKSTPMQIQDDSAQNKKLSVLFCQQCGREVPFDANLCPYCGNMMKK